MSDEQWLPIAGYEGYYEVSDQGRVRSVDRVVEYRDGRVGRYRGVSLRPRPKARGHLQVQLSHEGRPVNRNVHHLVLEAFVGPCPEGMEGLHWDDDPSNNRVENLRWGTSSENMLDRVRNGIHHQAAKTHCLRGHEFNDLNAFISRDSDGRVTKRDCRVCANDRRCANRAKARYDKMLAAAA